MLNINFPKIDKKTFNDLELSLAEEKIKINIRGKSKDFFTKVGKITSIILPTEANTSSSNEKFNALWLSPDEWMIYFDGKDTNNVIHNLFNEISKLNFGAITEISDHWVCFNIKGRKTFDLLSSSSPFNFNSFKKNKNNVAQTVLNHTDVIIHHKEVDDINLFVRRSFAEDLWLWINDSARFL